MRNWLTKILSWFRKPEPKPEPELPKIILPVKTPYRPKRRIPKKRCPQEDKTSYSEQSAKQIAQKLTNNYKKIRAYKCMFCPDWHITHHKNKMTLH